MRLLLLLIFIAIPTIAQAQETSPNSWEMKFYLAKATDPKPLVGDYRSIRSIGIVNLAEGKIHLGDQNSLFRRSDVTKDIAHWDVHKFTFDVVKSYLGNTFDIQSIPREITQNIPRAPFAREEREKPTDSSLLYRTHLSKLAVPEVDAFLVWRPMTNNGEEAITLTRALSNRSYVGISGHLDLVDAHSYEVIGSSGLRMIIRSGGEPVLAYPSGELEKPINFPDPLDLSAAELEKYRALVLSFIRSSLPVTLRRLGLTPVPVSTVQ